MAKFYRRGKTAIYFLPAVADVAAPISPSRAEITAGINLSLSIAEVSGWTLNNSPIMTPNLAETYTTQIAGEDTTDASTLTLYDDDTSTANRTALAKGTAGFVVIMPYGDVPTKRLEVWAATVIGINDEITIGNDPARVIVGFAITRVPEQNGVVPAAV